MKETGREEKEEEENKASGIRHKPRKEILRREGEKKVKISVVNVKCEESEGDENGESNEGK